MRNFLLRRRLLVFFCLFFSSVSSQANMKFAEQAFAEQQYEKALEEYLLAARVGNVHAQHALGRIYFQGLGTAVDKLQAASWFIVASENGHKASRDFAKAVIAELDDEENKALKDAVALRFASHSNDVIEALFFPTVIKEHLGDKVAFTERTDKDSLDPEEDAGGDASDVFGSIGFDDLGFDDNDDVDEGALGSTPTSLRRFSNYLFIADYLRHEDGTLRNLEPVLSYGRTGYAIRRAKQMKQTPAIFKGDPIEFPGRLHLGRSRENMSLFTIKDDFPKVYRGIRKNKKKAETGTAHDLYIYGLTLEYFPGISRDSKKTIDFFTKAAELGYDPAQFVLGMKMYREQIDPEKAVYWIGESAKQGLANAEYWLGKVLLISPWHESDERKAYFWFNRAATKGEYVPAILALSRLQLFAGEADLLNYGAAKANLTRLAMKEVENKEAKNPDVLHLMAWSLRKTGDKKAAILKMQSAIREARKLGWNTRQWRDELASWETRGVVRSEELAPTR